MKKKRIAVSAIAGILVLGLCAKFLIGSRDAAAVDSEQVSGSWDMWENDDAQKGGCKIYRLSDEAVIEPKDTGSLNGKLIVLDLGGYRKTIVRYTDFSSRIYAYFLRGEITAEWKEQQVYIDELFWDNDIEYCFLDIDGDGSGELHIRDDFACYVVKVQEGAPRVIWEDRTAMLAENEPEWSVRRLKNFTTWQEAYIDFIEKIPITEWVQDDGFCYSLIYVDADDVPELYIDTGFPISGEIIVSFYDGKIGCVNRDRGGLRYMERGGLLYSDYGATGFYPFNIYMLEKGEFSEIGTGWYSDYADEQGNVCFDFFWEGSPVTEAAFYARINELIDLSKCVEPSLRYSEEEILEILKNAIETVFSGKKDQ